MAAAYMRLIFQKVLTGRELWEEKKGKAMAGHREAVTQTPAPSQEGGGCRLRVLWPESDEKCLKTLSFGPQQRWGSFQDGGF